MKKIFFSLWFIIQILNLEAQNITLEQTLKYLNQKFLGKCIFEVEKNGIVIDFFNESGKKIREDRIVQPTDMDLESLNYDGTEKVLTFKCRKEADKCVERKLIIHKERADYARTNFIIENTDPKNIEGIKKAMVHLIMLLTDMKYESAEPFE